MAGKPFGWSTVHLLATIALDLLLAMTLLISVQIAAGWGELCGTRPGRDKSGLGGVATMFILFGFRWAALAVCLLYAPPTGERVWTLVGHTALGLVVSTGITAPAWAFAVHGINAGWLGDSLLALVSTGVVIALLHAAVHEQRRRSMS